MNMLRNMLVDQALAAGVLDTSPAHISSHSPPDFSFSLDKILSPSWCLILHFDL
jgi:hypothetical protein